MATKITTPELFNLSSNNTAATQLPVFTTSTRPTPTASTVQVEYLVIGGGGAGGGWGGGGGAGGYLTNYGGSKISLTSSVDYAIAVGEGGVKQANSGTRVAANAGEDSSIIGTGISVVADGGGGGGTMIFGSSTTEYPAQSGGSGGGASSMRNASVGGSGTTGQGNDGGNSPAQDPGYPGGGGGGGASSAGGDGQNSSGNNSPGNGGNGLASLITGTSIIRAGGGGGFLYGGPNTATDGGISTGGTGGGGAGGRYVSPSNGFLSTFSNGVDGQVNTGSGGGSGSVNPYQSGSNIYGGSTASGGSGIVILRYPTNSSPVIKTTGSLVYTQSTDGSDTVIQFTEGSGNVSFASAGIAVGEMIFNSTTEKVEYWDGFQWNMIKDELQTILASENFNISAYTGTGGTATDTDITSVGFKPDFAWFKGDTNTYYHVLYDSIRGTNAAISTNNTNGNYSNYNRLQSFNNDGYSIRANNAGDLWKINRTGNSFIVYGWKGGDGFVSNSDGNISVNVSANPDAGFSIVTGNVGSGAKTFGTGLNQAPELVIGIPTVASTGGWGVWFKDWTTYQYMQINNTNALTTAASDLWNLSNWNTTGLMGVTSSMWGTNSPFVHYCFHSVAGYSKIDSFVGSGNSGNKQTTGFEPGWIMLKRTSPAGAGWYIIDNVRGANKYLSANSNGAEQTSGSNLVFESDGFSFTGSSFNFSGHEHIYIAIAT